MNDDSLDELTRRLRAPIPRPYRPPPKPQRSWAGLKEGDFLVDKDTGVLWTVRVGTVTSAGVELLKVDVETPTVWPLTSRTWQTQFTKLSKKAAAQRQKENTR